jgi:hypothetical protein
MEKVYCNISFLIVINVDCKIDINVDIKYSFPTGYEI